MVIILEICTIFAQNTVDFKLTELAPVVSEILLLLHSVYVVWTFYLSSKSSKKILSRIFEALPVLKSDLHCVAYNGYL